MSHGDSTKELASLLKTLRADYPAALAPAQPCTIALDPTEPLLSHFVKAFLVWESTTPKALQAIKRLEAALVDFNELRACMPDETVRIIGERYPRAAERALRLRTALNILYTRAHRVTLEHLAGTPQKEAREYLDKLDGVPPFVAARVCLLGLAHHAAPVDSRIQRRLIEAKVCPAESSPEFGAAHLEKHARDGELPEVYALLQAWADDASYPAAESHLSDLRPRHKPVAEHIKREQEAARKAARKAKRSSRVLRKKKSARGSTKRRLR